MNRSLQTALIATCIAAVAATTFAASPIFPTRKDYRLWYDKTLWSHAVPEGMSWPFSLDEPAIEPFLGDDMFVHTNMEDPHNTNYELYYERPAQPTRVASFYDDEYVYFVVDAIKLPEVAETRCEFVPQSWNRLNFYIIDNGTTSMASPRLVLDGAGNVQKGPARFKGGWHGWKYDTDVVHAETADGGYRYGFRIPREQLKPLLQRRQGSGINFDRVDSETGALSALACAQQWSVADVGRMAELELIPAGQRYPEGVHVKRVDITMDDDTGMLTVRALVWNADTSVAPKLRVDKEHLEKVREDLTGEWDGNVAVFEFEPEIRENAFYFTFGDQHFDMKCVFAYHSGDELNGIGSYNLPTELADPDDVREKLIERAEGYLQTQKPDGSWPQGEADSGVHWGLRQLRGTLNKGLMLYNASKEPGGEKFRAPAMKTLKLVVSKQDPSGVWKNYNPQGEDTGVWGLAYHNGPIGTHMVELYEETGDEDFLKSAERLLEWTDNSFHVDTNNNYDAFMLRFYAAMYRLKQDPTILDRAMHHAVYGAGNGQLLDGSFPGHNFYGWYHDISVRGLYCVLREMPEDHPAYKGLKRAFLRGVDRMLRYQLPNGNFRAAHSRYSDQNYVCYRELIMRAAGMTNDPEALRQTDFIFYGKGWQWSEYSDWKRQRQAEADAAEAAEPAKAE